MIFSWFRKSALRGQKKAARKGNHSDSARKLAFKPSVESLETRLTPAGVSTFQFASLNAYVSELAGSVNVTVTRTGDTSAAASVQYFTSDETGKAGINYTAVAPGTTINFGANVTSVTVAIGIINDGVITDNHSFGVALANPNSPNILNGLAQSEVVVIQEGDGTKNQRFVNFLYLEMLNRNADPNGLANFTAELNAGVPSSTVISQLQSSSEYQYAEINMLYQRFLGRNADQSGLNGFAGELAGGASLLTVQAQMMSSAEYFNLAGTSAGAVPNNGYFVEQAYRDLLDRNPDQQGEINFINLLGGNASGSSTPAQRLNVLNGLIYSLEGTTDQVTLYYGIYLNRNPMNGEDNGFINELQTGTTLQVVQNQILSSPEYYGGI